jgi:hypothetical protein
MKKYLNDEIKINQFDKKTNNKSQPILRNQQFWLQTRS